MGAGEGQLAGDGGGTGEEGFKVGGRERGWDGVVGDSGEWVADLV